jgi:hypothetical protein
MKHVIESIDIIFAIGDCHGILELIQPCVRKRVISVGCRNFGLITVAKTLWGINIGFGITRIRLNAGTAFAQIDVTVLFDGAVSGG